MSEEHLGPRPGQRRPYARLREQLEGKQPAKKARKTKSKCCRKNPRCRDCPVVMHRLERSGALERNDLTLPRALREARRW